MNTLKKTPALSEWVNALKAEGYQQTAGNMSLADVDEQTTQLLGLSFFHEGMDITLTLDARQTGKDLAVATFVFSGKPFKNVVSRVYTKTSLVDVVENGFFSILDEVNIHFESMNNAAAIRAYGGPRLATTDGKHVDKLA